jgi:hypothetical protein
MECQDTIKSLKINLKKKINTIVLIVEGARYEFDLFDQIFRKLLHYKLVTKSRNQSEFKEYNEYVMNDNVNQKIIVINTKNSNIGSIIDDNEYRNELYKMLYEKYSIDIKNIPVYYIWDRDNKSNNKNIVMELIRKLNNTYNNDEFENGLLLLSYPCIESYTISCFEKNKSTLDTNIKDYVKNNKYNINLIDKYKIQRATLEMIKQLEKLGVNDFDIDNIKNINMQTFNNQEKYFELNNQYILLSFISYILLDQGIITFR